MYTHTHTHTHTRTLTCKFHFSLNMSIKSHIKKRPKIYFPFCWKKHVSHLPHVILSPIICFLGMTDRQTDRPKFNPNFDSFCGLIVGFADYTKSPLQEGTQLVMLGEPVKAWIARELVEMDEDVCLAIRSGPGTDEKEVRCNILCAC